MPVPSKARRRIEVEEEEEEEGNLCDQCKLPFDEGTFIHIQVAEDGAVEEEVVLCSRECLFDFYENELVDDRVERAAREERQFLHKLVCPACKRRVHQKVIEGV